MRASASRASVSRSRGIGGAAAARCGEGEEGLDVTARAHRRHRYPHRRRPSVSPCRTPPSRGPGTRGRRQVGGRVVVDGVQVGRHRALVEHAAGGLRHQPSAEPAALRRRTGDDGELVAEGTSCRLTPTPDRCSPVAGVDGDEHLAAEGPQPLRHRRVVGGDPGARVGEVEAGAVLHRNTPVKNRPGTRPQRGSAPGRPRCPRAPPHRVHDGGGTESTPTRPASDTPTTGYTCVRRGLDSARADPTTVSPGPSPGQRPSQLDRCANRRSCTARHGAARAGCSPPAAQREPRPARVPMSRTPSTWCSWMLSRSKPSRQAAM